MRYAVIKHTVVNDFFHSICGEVWDNVMGVWFVVYSWLDATCHGVVDQIALSFVLVGVGHRV